MMSGRFVITGGTVIIGDGQVRADVVVDGEQIVAITEGEVEVADAERVDAHGLLVMPGGIDVHTHFEEPDPDLLEGFTTGGAAAAAGGVTTVVEMPQAHPTTTTTELLREKIRLVERNAITDVALYGGVIGEPAQSTAELDRMAASGVAAFKSFMASSSPFFPAVDTAQLYRAMQTIARLELPYALHAEDGSLLADGLRRLQEAGRTDAMAHAESRPPLVEVVAVSTALILAEQTGCHVHICHAASAEALRLVKEAKQRGVRVTVETCPQYLVLNTDDLCRLKGFARCAPALRDRGEVDAIWPYVLDGTIDLVSSDHSPYPAARKELGEDDIFQAPLGMPGVQTLLPVFYDAAVNRRGMDQSQFVRQMSTNPARIFGLYPRKGTIAVGSDADLILFDPERTWTIRGEDAHHRHGWTPYEGRTVRGRVLRSIRRGETIFEDRSKDGKAGTITASPGSGRFVPCGYGRTTATPRT
jgi:allantoinase